MHRDQEEKEEQERIKRKVQKIRSMEAKRLQMHKKIEETVTAGPQHVDGENQQTYKSLSDAHYHLNYNQIKESHEQAVSENSIKSEK